MNNIIIETHPLPPFLPENARVLMLGSFPPPQNRWKMNFYYPNFNNDMWRILAWVFFQDKDYLIDTKNKNFDEHKIRNFLNQQGIAIYDTAYRVQRLQGNASDKFLRVIEPIDLKNILAKIPHCQTIITTGELATQTLFSHFPDHTAMPKIGFPIEIQYADKRLMIHRLPSSSRAYPLSLEKKVSMYQMVFQTIFLDLR